MPQQLSVLLSIHLGTDPRRWPPEPLLRKGELRLIGGEAIQKNPKKLNPTRCLRRPEWARATGAGALLDPLLLEFLLRHFHPFGLAMEAGAYQAASPDRCLMSSQKQ